MHHRDTIMGNIMLQCPIAISPLIFIVELFFMYVYHRFYKYKKPPAPKGPVETEEQLQKRLRKEELEAEALNEELWPRDKMTQEEKDLMDAIKSGKITTEE